MISSRIIGKVSEEPIVTLKQKQEFIILFDFRNDEITGIRYNGRGGYE
jgi:selenophosphate synthetase-related protein